MIQIRDQIFVNIRVTHKTTTHLDEKMYITNYANTLDKPCTHYSVQFKCNTFKQFNF